MRHIVVTCIAVLSVLSLLSLASAEDTKKESRIDPKLSKGQVVEFTLKQSSTTSSESSRGDFKGEDETEISYRIEVAEAKDNGDLTLKVSYPSVKARSSGRGDPWQFDSSKKPDNEDEVSSALRKAIQSTATVAFTGGKIGEISGLPEAPRPEAGQAGNGRLFRARRIASPRALRLDLELILSQAVLRQDLEKGKEYQPAREEPPAGADGQRGRFFGGAGRGPVAYKFEGEEKESGKSAAKFTLAAARREEPQGAAPAGTREAKSEGTALVSLEDGLLLKLTLTSDSSTKGERGGNSFSFKSKSRVELSRKGLDAPPKKASVTL